MANQYQKRIPKIIHQFWDGPKQAPSEMMKEWEESYTKAGWKYMLWDCKKLEQSIPGGGLKNKLQFDQMPQWSGKCNIARYEILHHYGGIYIDADSKFLRLIDEKLLDNESFCCWSNEHIRPGLATNSHMGAVAKSALTTALIQEISKLTGKAIHPDHGKEFTSLIESWKTTGPVLLTKVIKTYQLKTTTIYPSHYFIPNHYRKTLQGSTYKGNFEPYCDHTWGSTPGSGFNYKGKSSSTNPRITICTITHNRKDQLLKTLKCIEQQTYPLEKIEWLVLDDSNAYQGAINLTTDSPISIKYQRLSKKLTLGAKRNLSHKLCSGEIIVYMDDDDFYFPTRVSHAVETLQQSEKEIAGSTNLHIYFSHDDQLWLSGPFGKNHATAGTFAMTKEFANKNFYDKNATCNEEKSFLKNYTIPIAQLDPLQTMVCISHDANTFDKRRMRRNGATRRMRPLKAKEAHLLKQKLQHAGFLQNTSTDYITGEAIRAENQANDSEHPPIALVCGPWGSGTSALCALLNALGVHAQKPFFQTNDPRTPDCFEMLSFNRMVNKLVDETTLERKESSRTIQEELTRFRDQYFNIQGKQFHKLQLLKTPASSALLPELEKVFNLHLLICLREFKAIERSRRRRGWPAHLGQTGAEKIYRQLVDHTAVTDSPFLFIRHRDISEPQQCQLLLNRLANFLHLKPTQQQRQRALKAVYR